VTIGVPGLKCKRRPAAERQCKNSSEKELCNYGSTVMPFVVATRTVERGDAFQLGEKRGLDGQVLVFWGGLFYLSANMFIASNCRMINYELERI
jgi:hypothetical protein